MANVYVLKKNKIRNIKIFCTITANYEFGVYSVKIEEDNNQFDIGEELIANTKQFLLITQEEWNILKTNRIEDKGEDEQKKKDKKNKKSGKRKYRKK